YGRSIEPLDQSWPLDRGPRRLALIHGPFPASARPGVLQGEGMAGAECARWRRGWVRHCGLYRMVATQRVTKAPHAPAIDAVKWIRCEAVVWLGSGGRPMPC